jgi:hypothetical protein
MIRTHPVWPVRVQRSPSTGQTWTAGGDTAPGTPSSAAPAVRSYCTRENIEEQVASRLAILGFAGGRCVEDISVAVR